MHIFHITSLLCVGSVALLALVQRPVHLSVCPSVCLDLNLNPASRSHQVMSGRDLSLALRLGSSTVKCSMEEYSVQDPRQGGSNHFSQCR